MGQDYESTEIIGVDGQRIGTVERSWMDDNGEVRFVETATGSIGVKHRLVPVRAATIDGGQLQVAYTRDTIEHSPEIPRDAEMVEGSQLTDIIAYYRGREGEGAGQLAPEDVTWAPKAEQPEAAGAGADQMVGEVRDLGDVIEIPIVEEEIEVIKRPVVKEVIRIRKQIITEQRMVGADVRKEDIEVIQEGDTGMRDPGKA